MFCVLSNLREVKASSSSIDVSDQGEYFFHDMCSQMNSNSWDGAELPLPLRTSENNSENADERIADALKWHHSRMRVISGGDDEDGDMDGDGSFHTSRFFQMRISKALKKDDETPEETAYKARQGKGAGKKRGGVSSGQRAAKKSKAGGGGAGR